MRPTLLPVTAIALTLAACGSNEEPAAEPTAATTPTPLPSEIPAAYQGRWAPAAEDCAAEAGAATGLLEITATELKFHESVGTLGTVTAATGDRLRGEFAFTGEGEEWEREVVLDLRDEGQILVRREFGDDASPTPSDYTRCP